jgi:hypothetical protein
MKSLAKNQMLWIGLAIGAAGILPPIIFRSAFVEAGALPPLDTLPMRDTTWLEQWLVVITSFGVKPTYMLLSLLWIIWLWKRGESDLVALRWGLAWFLAGEVACAVNYLGFHGLCAMADYLHSYGMAVGFSFVAYAVLEGLDVRVIKYSPAESRCAALSLCRACIKHDNVSCGLRRLFGLFIPATILVALALPCAQIRVQAYRSHILDSVQEYINPRWSQLFETRYCAWLAMVLLSISWLVLLFKRENPVALAKVFFAGAIGPLGFGFLRLLLNSAYAEHQTWSNIWEEATELIFVAGTGFVLWTFRQSLFHAVSVPAAGKTGSPPIQS